MVVTNQYGSVTSALAVLVVGLPPGITAQPGSQTVTGGGTATFSVTAFGTGPLSYQWQCNGTNLPNGIITTIAGSGTAGYAGDNGPATNAQLYYPYSVRLGASGNLFIADTYNSRIRNLATNGVITTVAGNGNEGYSGDGGPATNASLNKPHDMVLDAFGNLFISDWGNNRIRKVGTNGIITTFVTGVNPMALAVDASGNLYITSTSNALSALEPGCILEEGTNGVMTLVAGGGFEGAVYQGPATNAGLYSPDGVAVDPTGNLLIADGGNQDVLKVESNGTITAVVNVTQETGNSGDGGPAITAELDSPGGLAVDAFGNLYIADLGNNRIRMVGTNGTITTVAGNGTEGYSGDNGPATNASLSLPYSQAVDAANNLFISDTLNNRIREVLFEGPTLVLNNIGASNAGTYDVVVSSPYGSVTSAVAVLTDGLPPGITTQPASQTIPLGSTASFSVTASGSGSFSYQWQFNGTNLPNGIITTVAGDGTGGYSGDGNSSISAELDYPVGVKLDAFGNLFIADFKNQRIRKVGTNGIITTVAGNGEAGYAGDGGPATNARLNGPVGLALDATGNLIFADVDNHRIRKVGTNGIITTLAGNGTAGYSGDNGPATNAQLYYPYSVVVDASSNLFIADSYNQRIRMVGTNGIITTVVGNGVDGYSGDGGRASSAELYYPFGIALDAFGNLFIADFGNERIRTVTTNGIILTVAGNGTEGYSGDGGAATNAELNSPVGLTVDTFGDLFIADFKNQRIREVGANATIATVAGNGVSNYFGDGGLATNAELNEPFGVTVDASGNLFIADQANNRVRKVFLQGPTLAFYNVADSNAGSYDVVVSNLYGSVTSSLATLTVEPQGAPQITLQPSNQSVALGGNASFSVGAAGIAPLVYQWRFGGTNLTAATNANFAVNPVAATNAGSYDVVITNDYGAITSAVATLSVLGVPVSFVTAPGGIQYSNALIYLSLSGLTGQGSVLIEASTNLTQWAPIFTNPSGFGTIQYIDPTASNSPLRFYRAVTPAP